MVDYYKSNAIYDSLINNKKVLVHSYSWKEDLKIIETLKK